MLVIGLAALLLPNVYMNGDLSRANEMMESTPPLAEKSLADAVGVHSHVLIHVSRFEAYKFGPVIDEIEALLQQHEADKSLSVEIVANKQGLRLLDADRSEFAHRLELLTKRFDTLRLVACAKSLVQLASAGEPFKLLKSIVSTPTAVQQVARRTAEGSGCTSRFDGICSGRLSYSPWVVAVLLSCWHI